MEEKHGESTSLAAGSLPGVPAATRRRPGDDAPTLPGQMALEQVPDVADLRGAALFDGSRGAPPADRGALVDIVTRLSQFAVDHEDRIDEIELNPVRVYAQGDGVTVLDALIVKRSAP